MRLWSLHPRHLDRAGLVAGWREALLAQAVLAGRTTGYRNHPQLERFKNVCDPLEAIGSFLLGVHDEATARGYRFDASKILKTREHCTEADRISVTDGQLAVEWRHLGRKLALRSPRHAELWRDSEPTPHPLFFVVPGEPESWERLTGASTYS